MDLNFYLTDLHCQFCVLYVYHLMINNITSTALDIAFVK
ncbi:hypothetical protein EMUCRT_0150 [Ehrlichia cf. muris str. EmCRT]|uniref:Uncharacterized protein n=1 Tax=Ehrlichia cf. muris str. EmCRT TaxID=1359167 RepID=A0A0F3ND49_9RICK|nr:hypothetical protein EMUCRT_0150 [Ehrlichia cf. muris str. EmCRT]